MRIDLQIVRRKSVKPLSTRESLKQANIAGGEEIVSYSAYNRVATMLMCAPSRKRTALAVEQDMLLMVVSQDRRTLWANRGSTVSSVGVDTFLVNREYAYGSDTIYVIPEVQASNDYMVNNIHVFERDRPTIYISVGSPCQKVLTSTISLFSPICIHRPFPSQEGR